MLVLHIAVAVAFAAAVAVAAVEKLISDGDKFDIVLS